MLLYSYKYLEINFEKQEREHIQIDLFIFYKAFLLSFPDTTLPLVFSHTF